MTAASQRRYAKSAPGASFWRSLHYFSIYRLCAAMLFLAASFPHGWPSTFDLLWPDLSALVRLAYAVVALMFLWLLPRLTLSFNFILTAEVLTDIAALTLLMHTAGGTRSGFGYMLLVVLAGAGLVGQGRLSLFFAATASLAVLAEQSYRAISDAAVAADFVHTGSISLGFFGVAVTAHLLARRVAANELLAMRRGVELADQVHINEQVIRDMQDGVLVVDPAGQVHQFNPQAIALLAAKPPAHGDLAAFSRALAERYPRWRAQGGEISEAVRIPATGRLVRVRYLPATSGGNALIYLEDLERAQARTQQIKLAALGRLTANMAHEIRNPLAAISQAAELLAEGAGAETQARLTRIIGDNTERLNRLVAEVLELGRRDRAHPEPIRLAAFLDAFVDELSLHEPKARQVLAVEVPADILLRFDRGHLSRILLNLVGNALRFCQGEAGSIRIRAEADAATGQVDIHVADDGPGIDEERRAQVFEPFFTTDSHGTGLGLYIARELCEANDATLVLRDNAPGAHFCISARGETCQQETSESSAAIRSAS